MIFPLFLNEFAVFDLDMNTLTRREISHCTLSIIGLQVFDGIIKGVHKNPLGLTWWY